MENKKITVADKIAANRAKFDQIQTRMGLIKSLYPTVNEYGSVPESIYREYQALSSLRMYIIESTFYSNLENPIVTNSGLIIDSHILSKKDHTNNECDFEKKLRDSILLRKENEKYISKEQVNSFRLPRLDTKALKAQIDQSNDTKDLFRIGSDFSQIALDQTMEDYQIVKNLANLASDKAVKVSDLRKQKIKEEREKQRKAYDAAKERYNNLGFFKKLKLRISKKDFWSIASYDSSIEDLDSMYTGKSR